MIVLLSIAWLVVAFGAFAAGRLRGLREALEIIEEQVKIAPGPEAYFEVLIAITNRIIEKTRRWAPWALWR
jgi:hypothetical protein